MLHEWQMQQLRKEKGCTIHLINFVLTTWTIDAADVKQSRMHDSILCIRSHLLLRAITKRGMYESTLFFNMSNSHWHSPNTRDQITCPKTQSLLIRLTQIKWYTSEYLVHVRQQVWPFIVYCLSISASESGIVDHNMIYQSNHPPVQHKADMK